VAPLGAILLGEKEAPVAPARRSFFAASPREPRCRIVEWLDRVPRAAPPDLPLLHFEFGEGDQDREITARAFGKRPRDLLRRWLVAGS
jgi:hypothetical protein